MAPAYQGFDWMFAARSRMSHSFRFFHSGKLYEGERTGYLDWGSGLLIRGTPAAVAAGLVQAVADHF